MSTLLNSGRNDIPLSNSNAQCLLENWVEEVTVSLIWFCIVSITTRTTPVLSTLVTCLLAILIYAHHGM